MCQRRWMRKKPMIPDHDTATTPRRDATHPDERTATDAHMLMIADALETNAYQELAS